MACHREVVDAVRSCVQDGVLLGDRYKNTTRHRRNPAVGEDLAGAPRCTYRLQGRR